MIKPDDILQFAEELDKKHVSEVAFRTVIGRAYYASYHKAKMSPKAKNFKSPRRSEHDALIKFYKNCPDIECKVIGNKLSDLRALRTKADYFISDELDAYSGQKAIGVAKQIFKLC